jgi:hypothetical protein
MSSTARDWRGGQRHVGVVREDGPLRQQAFVRREAGERPTSCEQMHLAGRGRLRGVLCGSRAFARVPERPCVP